MPRRAAAAKGCATTVAARRGHVVQPFRAACSAACLIVATIAAGCSRSPAPASSDVFTTARATFGDAARDFFSIRRNAQQPIPFPHKTHIAKKAVCTDCHETVEKGPIAGIPSVKTCMICHSQIALDKPLIKEVTAYADKGVEIPWQRVYGFTHAAHVRFQHAPHVRANVDCAVCHGDLANQTVAERVVDHNMGFCVSCHRQKGASNDCLTCHY
jgi:cytochrome c7-like protein